MNVKVFIFALLRYEINGTQLDERTKNLITPEVLPALYKLSKAHDLAHLVADALDKNGLLDDLDISKKFRAERNLAIYRYEQSQYELEEICRVLEEEKIDHIPLKGSVLRAYYPNAWMRTSCDIDIFIKKTDIPQAICALEEKLQYTHDGSCPHDESLHSESGVHLELHYDLIEEHIAGEGAEILNAVWEYTRASDGYLHKKEMTDEMFYFYHIAHMAKHFISGGCGVRAFLDLWILNHCLPENISNREKLLEKGGYLAFEKASKNLAEVWLSGAEESETIKLMEEYILLGGVYGTIDNQVALKSAQKGGKFAYWMSRIFLPYKQLKTVYPILQKHKWLTPIFQVVRWFSILFKGNRVRKSMREMKASATLTEERREKMDNMLNELGLK